MKFVKVTLQRVEIVKKVVCNMLLFNVLHIWDTKLRQ